MKHKWEADRKQRIDVFLGRQAKIGSRSKAQKMLKEGCIALNGTRVQKASLVLSEGDIVELLYEQKEREQTIVASGLPLAVLYEDQECMVVAKPAGISVHPGAGTRVETPTILNGVAELFFKRHIPFHTGSVLVHRLDKETTGCLLIAKNPLVHSTLQHQFAQRTVSKQYLAIVSGVPKPARATIDAPIGRSTAERTKMSVHHAGTVRLARTSYEILGRAKNADSALLLCDLHTGRTHQVRVHLQSIGHPILGDAKYFSEASRRISKHYAIDALCLHAWKLAFTAASGKSVEVIAPLEQYFYNVLHCLGVQETNAIFSSP